MHSIRVDHTLLFCGCVSYVKLGSSTRLRKITHKDVFCIITQSHKASYTKITQGVITTRCGVTLHRIPGKKKPPKAV